MGVRITYFAPAFAEIFVLGMACLTLLVYLFVPKRAKIVTYILVQATLVVAAIITLLQFGQSPVTTFNGTFILDNLAVMLKLFIYLSSFFAFIYARSYLPKTSMPYGEYYLLGLFSVLGMMVIVSGHSFITLFLGLELFSLPVYAMVALPRKSAICSEAAIKYFVIGSLASGMLLYGLSMLYGATRSLDISTVAQAIMRTPVDHELILLFGMVFVVVGIAFKLGAVPFHMWVPDVYEGAPTPVVLFLGTGAKIAAAGLAFRLLNDTLFGLDMQWQQLLIVIAVLSMALGNLAAIVQTSIKRMLGYSSIAHMGYMTLGLLTATPEGYGAALFYVITYALMTLGAFGLITMMNNSGYEASNIDDLRGLNSRNPWLALMMLFTMFSLAGVPPIVGFMAKVAVLEALIGVHMVWLAAIALLFAVIGAYYYIRVVKVMYFESPLDETPIKYPRDTQLAITVNGLLLLVLGVVPGFLFTLCQAAFNSKFY
ncbi:MAG TPA: NADH-quinone oxidoreductase subunit NuoN [Gammaproteobacteria bacterium]|nr:NADH-quinone oxidoreductase subunit NuoN [Gammaproteobacteria bacterium]